MSQTTRYKPSPDVMLSTVDDGAVLLHLKRGIYFGLNPVGADIWEMLGKGLDSDTCASQLVERYDIDKATAASDYQTLINELLEQGLIDTK